VGVPRSEVRIDLGALRSNVRTLLAALAGAELWAVVKADAYGHGALPVARAALEEGASALCVATVEEALELRAELIEPRILVMGPATDDDFRAARQARLELAAGAEPIPGNVPVHVKLDTGMGRWGLERLPSPLPANAVAVMSHLASADCDEAFTRRQVERFREATAGLDGVTLHLANSAGALRFADARLDAARCGVALYGLSPFGADPAADGFRPVLSWHSTLAQVKRLGPGQSTGYGRRFVAREPTWIGLVPVGYADGFRRDLTGTSVLVDGEPCPVVGTISMDAFAVALPGQLSPGTGVTIVGDGILLEDHARVAGTINYELACHVGRSAARTSRVLRP
jgi:alanine racemase